MKLLFVENSFLKQSTEQSGDIQPELLIAKSRNQVIDVSSVKSATEGHLEIVSEGKKYFVYDLHVELYDDSGKIVTSYNVMDEASPQVDAKEIPDGEVKKSNVRMVKMNFMGTIDINSPVFPGSSFTWSEVFKGGTRQPHNSQVIKNAVILAKRLQPFRLQIGKPFNVTSWYRDPVSNRRVFGAKNSTHLTALGIDFWIEGMTSRQMYDYFDPRWGNGGVGKYANLSILHLDARSSAKFRWFH